MKIKLSEKFKNKLKKQIEYISYDKPKAARNLKKNILKEIKNLPSMPYINRESIYVQNKNTRDLIVKGYAITYFINHSENCIEVFGFTKWENEI